MKQNTKRLYSLIFALLFLVLAMVIYFDLVVPAYSDLSNSKGNLNGQKALLANEQSIASQINNLLATYQTQAADVQLADQSLPNVPDLADAIAQVYGIAQAANMNVQTMGIADTLGQATPGMSGTIAGAAAAGQVVEPISKLTFSLDLTGSYENFKNFLSLMQNNIRIFDVTTASVVPVQTGGKTTGDLFTFSITAETYYQQSQ